jgi:hypothetical protein
MQKAITKDGKHEQIQHVDNKRKEKCRIIPYIYTNNHMYIEHKVSLTNTSTVYYPIRHQHLPITQGYKAESVKDI